MTDTTPEVDFSEFAADVDRVVEAAAERDARFSDATAQYQAFLAKIRNRRIEIDEELAKLDRRADTARRVHVQRIAAIRADFTAATGGLVDDEEPF